MPDENNPTNIEQGTGDSAVTPPAPSSDATENTDKGQGEGKHRQETEKQTHVSMVRFEEVNTRMKAAEDENRRIKKEQADADRKRKADEGKWQELYEGQSTELETARKQLEELTSYKERYEKMVEARKESNERRIADIPETKRTLIPTAYDPIALSDWLDANAADLKTPRAPDFDPGVRGDKPKPKVNLTADQEAWAKRLNIPLEKYAAQLAAIAAEPQLTIKDEEL